MAHVIIEVAIRKSNSNTFRMSREQLRVKIDIVVIKKIPRSYINEIERYFIF